MRKFLPAILATLAVLGGAAFGFDRANSTGVASHDLKRDVVTAQFAGSGVNTFSVTCPDGGVAISLGLDNTDIFAEPFYYHVSSRVAFDAHGGTAVLGADYNDGLPYNVKLTAVCVSLAS